MVIEEMRRRRVARMVDLARVYRGWSAAELGDALGRSASRAAPRSGNPKLDLVARLAEALEWDIGPVAESMWEVGDGFDAEPTDEPGARRTKFVACDHEAQRCHRAGEFHAMAATARAMRRLAATPSERAIAANRLAGAFDGLGRYTKVLAAVQEGLAEQGIGRELRTMLTVNLANAHYTLWNIHEARAVASALLEGFELAPREFHESRIGRVATAFAHAIRGHALRRLLGQCEDSNELEHHARAAEANLVHAECHFEELYARYSDEQYAALANTARGGAIEARVASGSLDAADAVASIVDTLEDAVDLSAMPDRNRIESWGWWSVFGANIALREGERTLGTLAESSDFDRAMAVFTNKASEIAEHLDLWPIYERSFTIEWFRRQRATGRGEEMPAWTLDADDLRVLVGTMGRFPLFRATGFAILDAAAIDGDSWLPTGASTE